MVLFSVAPVHAHVPHDIIYSLDVSPTFSADGQVFASSTQFGEGHLVSSNYGETFSESHAGMQRTLVTGHTFSPNYAEDGTIFMVTKEGYYKSTDRGRNWQKQTSFANEEVLSICTASDFLETQEIYLLTKNAIHRVSDTAQAADKRRKEPAASALPLKKFDDTTFGKISICGGNLFVHRVFYDTPKKKNGMELVDYATGTVDVLNIATGEWSTFAAPFESKVISDFDISIDGSSAIAGLKDGSVHLSEDSCQTWKQVFQRKDDFVCKLKFSPNYANDGTIVCGTAKGFVFLSSNHGDDWEVRSNGLSRWVHHVNILINKIVFSPNYKNDKTILLGKTTGLYRSANAGRSWSKVNEVDTAKEIGKPVLYRKLGISPEFGNDGLMFLFSVPRKILGVTEKHVWKFNDKTKELKQISIGRDNNYINGFAFAPKGSEQKLVFAATAQGPFVSQDEGNSWQQLSRNGAQKLFVSPNLDRDGLIYLMDNKGRVHVSKDTGQSFKPTKLNLDGHYIDNLTFSPNYRDDKTLFVTTFGDGVFRSKDAGETWSYFGLKGKWLFSGPTFSTKYATDNTMFAPTVDGIYRSTDAGNTWKNVLRKTLWLPKVPLLTLRDATGHEIPLTFGVPEEMKRYKAYDDTIGEKMFRKPPGAVQKIRSPKAYLASYYKFRVKADHAVEICFYGSGIEYQCV